MKMKIAYTTPKDLEELQVLRAADFGKQFLNPTLGANQIKLIKDDKGDAGVEKLQTFVDKLSQHESGEKVGQERS
jgi:hypothetical protein